MVSPEQTPITVQIDTEALREQISSAIEDANRVVSIQLRQAADVLDPEFMENHTKWMVSQQRKTVSEEDLNLLAQYFYNEVWREFDVGVELSMKDKGLLVAAVRRALGRIGFTVER